MSQPLHDGLPPMTALEGRLERVPFLNSLIRKFNRTRKDRHAAMARRKDRECPSDLRNFERKVWSQFGEDGIIEEIFNRIGDGTKFAVEFGIETGEECNARHLIEARGWSAVLLDGSTTGVAAARRLYDGKPVQVLERFLTTENILDIFAEAGVPRELDFLSIDVDGNDYWLCEKILTAYRPRVLAVEYNARWAPPKRWVMPYNPEHDWDGSVYFGASLQSLVDLTSPRGYRLVCCTYNGLNAFFVRDDQLGDHFPSASRGASYHYAAPLYNIGFGHPVRRPLRNPAYYKCYGRLTAEVRSLADATHQLFLKDPLDPSLQLTKVGRFRSIHVGPHHRALAAEDGSDLVWFWVGTLDECERRIEELRSS